MFSLVIMTEPYASHDASKTEPMHCALQSLVNRTPPLVMVWSNPKKAKLTQPEGVALAARLYGDAVQRGKVRDAALWGLECVSMRLQGVREFSIREVSIRGSTRTCNCMQLRRVER